MAFINFDTSATKLTQPTGWRAFVSAIVAWVNGEVITRRDAYAEEEIFKPAADSFDLIAPHLIDDSEIYIVDHAGGELLQKVSNVAAVARSVTTFDNIAEAVSHKMRHVYANNILIINIDVIKDMGNVVEQLMALKRESPFVPVVICSRTFSKNNFTLQRSAIADASLRLPCGNVSMALAIESAITNTNNMFH